MLLRIIRLGLLTLILSIAVFSHCYAQNQPTLTSHPDTLISTNDTLYQYLQNWNFVIPNSLTIEDTIVWESNGYQGAYFKFWTNLDSSSIPYVNHPYQQVVTVPILSTKGSIHYLKLIFRESNSNFTADYIKSHTNTVSIEIPEVYELANIILFLSDCSVKTKNRPNSEYAQKVKSHFKPFQDHPLIQIINKKCEQNYWSTYYTFRENSICYSFINDFLKYNTPYKHVFGDPFILKAGEFRNLLYLIQDFSEKSRFRSFYKTNNDYYNELITKQKKTLPVEKMWKWLETEFPIKYEAYKIIFSPLIEGSHSTQQYFSGFVHNPDFKECVMFINSTERLEAEYVDNEALLEGMMSGIIFTEIDHNYVNHASSNYLSYCEQLIDKEDLWASKEARQNYPSKLAIFNEYMTHSLFCLYVTENYTKDIAEIIVGKRTKLMERRGFLKFEKFNTSLIKYLTNRTSTVYDLYVDVIDNIAKQF